MADIRTIWDVPNGRADWKLAPAHVNLILDQTGASIVDEHGAPLTDAPEAFSAGQGLDAGGDLLTAVAISLLTDRVADPDDVIPDGTQDPRGWWGDLGSDRTIGSKIWLRLRAKQTDALLAIVRNDIEEALAWLVADGVAVRVEVDTEWTRPGMLGARVVVSRQIGAAVAMKFGWAWKEF